MPTFTRPITPARRVIAALVTALGVAAAAHLATVFAFFIANGAAAENLGPINNYFMPGALVLFLIVAIAASLGAFRRWWTALIVGVVGAAIGAFAGTSWGYVAAGNGWSSDAAAYVIGTLGGASLPFIVFSTIAAVTAGRAIWACAMRLFPGTVKPIALVRQPSSKLAEGELTHLERVAVDQDLADEQWEAYVTALTDNGFEVVDVDPSELHPDSVFIEDTLVIFGGTAVVTSPGAETRRGETDAPAEAARVLGLDVRTIELPGTLDGGDVLKIGSKVYVGRGGRTNAEGIRQLRAIVSPLGYRVIAVPVKKVLHLKSAVTALPDGTVVGYAKHVDNPAAFDRFLALPEPGAAVVVLSDDAVLMASSVPKSAAIVADLGYRVVTVDVSEFEKLEGCVTCLSVRVR